MSTRFTAHLGLAAIAALGFAVSGLSALGTGQSFTTLHPQYEQELYGVTQMPGDEEGVSVLGGVAFAPNGDVWSAECTFGFFGTKLHRFQKGATVTPAVHGTSTLHPETVIPTSGGCGLTNHPDGVHMYSNSALGVVQLDAETGAVTATYPNSSQTVNQPNALGIAIDPRTSHVVYVGAGCHPSLAPDETFCKIYDLDPVTGAVTTFASVSRDDVPFVDGVFFDPTGTYAFLSNRALTPQLTVLRRPEDVDATHPQVAQSVTLPGEPDGVAFHGGADKFVVTNDEDPGTMTKVKFPGDDYSQPPSVETFASGGFRGDLLQVGVDGCIYATQGRDFLPTDHGTRYDDGTETTEDSIVRICPKSGTDGFVPPPGVRETVKEPGSIAGSVYFDADGSHTISTGDTLLGGVTVTLSGAASGTQTSATGSEPTWTFTALQAGAYSVSVPATAFGYVLSAATPAPLSVSLASGEHRTGLNFLYEAGSLAGSVFVDANDNGSIDPADTLLGGVPVSLSNGAETVAGGGPATPTYRFPGLAAGSYTVTAPAAFAGYARAIAPASVDLAAGQNRTGLDFLYAPGRLSGYAYIDTNLNHQKDPGEPGLAGVTITFGAQTRVTDGAGFYLFGNLLAGSFVLTAPTPFGTYQLNTPASLSGVLPAGGRVTDQNFGYKPAPVVTPTMTIQKTASTATYSRVGQKITYTYTVTNTGTVPLSGPFTVVDDKLGSFPCGAATAALAPGASLSCTRDYVIQSSDLGNIASLPTNVPANVDTGQWLAGNLSTQDTLITDAGAGIPNGIYPGWCIQDYVVYDLHNQPGTLYSTIGGNLPADLAAIQWGKVNWVLNHKLRAPGATNVQFFKDVQTAIWVSVGEPNPEFGISPAAQQMIDEANQHADYVPGVGEIVAVVIYSDGMTVFPGSIQESILEMKLLQSITNDAYVTVSFDNTTISSPHTQVTVNQVYVPPFVTYTQGGWGATPSGNNPAMLLKNNFAAVYPSGVTIGIPGVSGRYYLKFTTSTAIRNFLPAGGTPKALRASATNPTTSAAGVFAGQVLAVQLAVDFSNAGKITGGLAGLKVAPGYALAGKTVAQVLALANRVLGGDTTALPAGMSISGLNDVMTRINENFDNGTTNNGFLVP